MGGLWKKQTDKNGEWFIEGPFTFGSKIRIFENKYKRKDTDPDYNWSIAPKEESKIKPQARPHPRPAETFGPKTPTPVVNYAPTNDPNENNPPWPEEDELPF